MSVVPPPNFSHLLSLSGPFGTFEHAEYARARVERGYCTDDVARVLVVLARETSADHDLANLAASSMTFLELAQGPTGEFRNRRLASGGWEGPFTSEDCWGRATWALGSVIASDAEPGLRARAMRLFDQAVTVRSVWPRSMAFAAIGAAAVLGHDPSHDGARQLLLAARDTLGRPELGGTWRWPESRLAYANAVMPEALIASGVVFGDDHLVERGLRQLRWLLERETRDGHLSVTPVGGRGPGDLPLRFDQQPIEVAAMSDACVRAFDATNDVAWTVGCDMAVQWFMGENDASAPMFDPLTGGGYDGLMATGANLNQGAESTIALLTTLQHARRFAPATS